MGTDYYAFKPKEGVNLDRLKLLIEKQARLFQSNPYLWNASYAGELGYISDYLNHLNAKPLLDVTDEIRSLIDYKTLKATAEQVVDSFRVGAISLCGFIFPFAWRVDSYRSLLPEDVMPFFDRRALWLDEVKSGKHRDVIAQTYCLHVYRVLRSSYLFDYIREGFSKPDGHKKLGKDFFERAMLFPLPCHEPDVEMDISQLDSGIDIFGQVAYYSDLVSRFAELVKTWNSNNPSKHKVHEHLDAYKDLETYIKTYSYDWFDNLYSWVKNVNNEGYGLALSF